MGVKAIVSACGPGAAVVMPKWSSHCPVAEVEVLQDDVEDGEDTETGILPNEMESMIMIRGNEIITNRE